MSDLGTRSMTVYRTPDWGSRIVRIAMVSQSGDGTYLVDQVPVAAVSTVGLFSVLTCVDGTTHVVLTAFLRLVRDDPPREESV